jgi:uncharacterized membrane protein YbhN (UPF0104 family)
VLIAGGFALLTTVAILFGRHGFAVSSVVLHANVGWVLGACAATGLSLLAAMWNLTAFSPLRLPAVETFRAQLAVCGLRVIAPSAVSTPAICARYLSRSGLGAAEALAVVGTAQSAQLIMTVVVVGSLAGCGVDNVPAPDPMDLAIGGGGAVVLVAAVVVLGRRVGVIRRGASAVWSGLRDVLTHARRRPLTIAGGLGASAMLTLAHVAAFACCVAAVGGHAALLTLTAIYLAAASAGSLIPAPAGVGAVEATMIAGLVGAGLTGGTAAAAALLTRVITVWALAPPGWLAVRSLRRRGLL